MKCFSRRFILARFQGCIKDISEVLPKSFKGFSRVNELFLSVSKKFQEYFKEVSNKFQGSLRKFQEYFKNISRVL